MTVICPTITAFDLHEYRSQLEIASKLSNRVHIDLMDGLFAPTISPELSKIWLPLNAEADIHLMFKHPMQQLEQLIKLAPHMVIIQAEADVHHMQFAGELHKHGIMAGLSILQETPVGNIEQIMHSFDHVLVFSGSLGHHGGVADFEMLGKVSRLRAEHPDVEISWDGGISDQNAKQLVDAGVNVLNVGGFIQKSDDPEVAYRKILDSLL
jgi:ribulose-phosphate 3-epimerase